MTCNCHTGSDKPYALEDYLEPPERTWLVPFSQVAHLFEQDSLVAGTASDDAIPQGVTTRPGATLTEQAEEIVNARRSHAASLRHATQCRPAPGHVCVTCGKGAS